LENWRISRKLFGAFAVIALSLVGAAGVVFADLSIVQDQSELADHAQDGLSKAGALTRAMLDMSGQVRGYLLTRDESFAKGVDADEKSILQGVAELQGAGLAPEQKDHLEQIAQAAAAFVSEAVDPEIKLARDSATLNQALALMNTGVNTRDLDAFKAAVGVFNDAEGALLTERKAARDNALAGARMTLIAGVSFVVGLSFLLGWLLSRTIAMPMRAMTQTVRRLADGDHKVQVPATHRRDEVGEMANAVLSFKDAAIEKLRLEQQTAADRDTAERERKSREDDRALAARAQAQVVEGLAHALSRLSTGDLTLALQEPFAAEYEALRADFNKAVDSLRQAMAAIGGATVGMISGADEIAVAAQDLAHRSEQQAASLEETAAALDEITATVQRSAEGAQQASSVVSSAKSDATRSGEVVRETVAAMDQIEQSSQKIGQIIGVIDEIAFQTSLLALNAGVEAARAGDRGKGFAVVASEVRALAQRSAEAAKEIKTLIATSSSQVAQGVRLVGETGLALTGIVAKVSEIDSLVVGIAASSREQAIGLSQVNTAVNQMDQTTQQNAAMVEQTATSAAELKSRAGELSRLVSRFHISTRTPALSDRPRAERGVTVSGPFAEARARIAAFARGGESAA
jgi:methyl-accepting chemotaxis protein